MRSDDIASLNSPNVKTISPSSSPRDRIINIKTEGQSSSSSASSGSSLPDLKRRLQDLPLPNEFTFIADRVAALGRRICRKRERFLRLQGVADRIEESDEWEEREHSEESTENSSRVPKQKNARARRRARIFLEDQFCDDKAMVISQSDDITGPSKLTDDNKRNPTESSADQSMRDHVRLPTIKVSRRQPRPSSLSEPTSTRFSYQDTYDNNTSRDIKSHVGCHSHRHFMQHDNTSKSTDLPSVAPFSLSNVRMRKFGGYRPPSSNSVILKNLSSGSESESTNDANRQFSITRRIRGSNATLELSSPEGKFTTISEPIKKMPIMSARSDITSSILPNLLPSSRSFCSDNVDHRILQDTPRNYVTAQVNREKSVKEVSNEMEKIIVQDRPISAIYNERMQSDEVTNQICNYEQALKYENAKEKITQNILNSSRRSLSPDSRTGSYFHCPKTPERYNNIEIEEARQFDPNLTNQFDLIFNKNLKDYPSTSSNKEALNIAEWDRTITLYKKGIINTPHLIAKVQNGVTEDALSSQTSEPMESEDHSRSSCTPKIDFQNETFDETYKRAILSTRRAQNDIDTSHKCNQEIATITNVPTLVLNSQDISYSTSADSRDCSAMRSLDTHALIKALSDVSLKQVKEKENDPRNCEDFYWQQKNIPNVSTKGETWRVPKSSASELSKKSLSRIPSKIPVRILNNEITSSTSTNKAPRYHTNSSRITNYAKSKNGKLKDTVKVLDTPVNNHRIGSKIFSNVENPQTSFNDHTYNKTLYLQGNFNENCPPALCHETTYSTDRDFSKIDDDVRSKSDRSTSRRSMETMDITSATESSCLAKYTNDLTHKNKSSRNVLENVTWRTEDECVSINDEESSADARNKDHYESYNDKPEELYSQMEKCFKSGNDATNHNSFPSRTRIITSSERMSRKQIFINDKLEINEEAIKMVQSQSLISQKEQETPNFAARVSSSTLKLACESKKKKKSQERFPFTISEALDKPSTKRKDTIELHTADKNVRGAQRDDQLKVHPSITRLATSGLEDTAAKILCHAAEELKNDKRISKSRMKRFTRIFSLKRKRKRSNNVSSELTKIIYENRACQEISKANSCSDGSSMEDGDVKVNYDKSAKSQWTVQHTTIPNLFFDGNTLKKKEDPETIHQKESCRRCDRDDLWVQGFKDSSLEDNDNEVLRDEIGNLERIESPAKDQYSVFLAKNVQPDKELDIVHSKSSKEQESGMPISGHVVPPVTESKKEIDQKIDANQAPEIEEIEEDLTGCLCLRLCRLIAPSRYRLPIMKKAASTKTKKPGLLLRKRKK